MKLYWTGIGCAILVTATTLGANAQGTADDATRSAARSLGYEGVAAYEKGEYAAAVEKLERAFRVVKVPTVGLWLARALAKTGKLVEASERYAEAMRLEVSGSQTQAQKQAQSEATAERNALIPKIPNIKIVVEGVSSDSVEVQIDGASIPSALFGAPRPINPGNHVVTGKLGTQQKTANVSMIQGSSQEVVLKFEAISEGGQAEPARPTGLATGQVSPAKDATTTPTKSSWQKTAGWVGIGLGAAGIGIGAFTGVMAMQKRTSVSNECTGNVCAQSAWDEVDSINTLRTVSTVGFVAGAVVLGVGTTLLLTAPRKEAKAGVVGAYIGLNSAGIAGRF